LVTRHIQYPITLMSLPSNLRHLNAPYLKVCNFENYSKRNIQQKYIFNRLKYQSVQHTNLSYNLRRLGI